MGLPDWWCRVDLPFQRAELLNGNLFDLFDLPSSVSSPVLERTHALRMRFVWCNIAHALYPNQPLGPSLPPLTFLDLSTCAISVNDVRFLLQNSRCLRHLILDGCDTLDNALIEGWAVFGHDCLMINDGLGLEYEISQAQLSPATVHVLASQPVAPTTPSVGSPSRASILPWSSKLRTLALSAPPHSDADAQRTLVAAFQRGWGEAVTEFNDRLRAVRQSRSKGVQTLRFVYPGEDGNHTGYPGIVVVDDDEFAHFNKLIDIDDCPVVCLAGQAGREGGIEHAEGCAHSIGWDIWEDTL
ncbi:hypothetical protein BJV74DRAFT_489069 [Russula compacta]|nr:hypothetical protein BJV74DRAFT_489069 [Russula compacta]